MYTAFAVIEKVYSSLTSTHNFMIFGGMLMEKVCLGMMENPTIISLFSGLFDNNNFSEETITAIMRHHMKVFGNVRVKDLCFRCNSNTMNRVAVALHQTLAAGGRMGDDAGRKKG